MEEQITPTPLKIVLLLRVFPSNNLELGLWMEAEKMHILSSTKLLIPKMRLKKKKDCVMTSPYGQMIPE
jgi:hypothetical protein